jgi:hypothetical protein
VPAPVQAHAPTHAPHEDITHGIDEEVKLPADTPIQYGRAPNQNAQAPVQSAPEDAKLPEQRYDFLNAGKTPINAKCAKCDKEVTTVVKSTPLSGFGLILCVILCIFGWCCCLCCIALCCTRTHAHYCPHCHDVLNINLI